MTMEKKFKLMTKACPSGWWHVEYFDTEKEAKTAANWDWKTGAMYIELYKKERVGYGLVKKVYQSKSQSMRKFADCIEDGWDEFMNGCLKA